MKKYFLLMAGFILLAFAACQNDELVNGKEGVKTNASFKVRIPANGVSTRADGVDNAANRCILEIYLGDALYGERQVVAVSDNVATFDVQLVTNQTYDFVFWADNVDETDLTVDKHYVTNSVDGLKNITFNGDYTGNTVTRDAFTAKENKEVTGAFTLDVNLTRPFGQLNIKTNDIAAIKVEVLQPVTALLTFKQVYTAFNAYDETYTGELSEVTYKNAAEVVDAEGNLTMDYILAPADERLLVDMTLNLYKGDGSPLTSKELNSIPVKRNYKTNVEGNLLTENGKLTVKVVPGYNEPVLSEKVLTVATVDEVAEALKNNANVVVSEKPTKDVEIALPKYNNEEQAIAITLPETEQTITIKYDEEMDGSAPKTLNITIPTAEKVIIDAKETTVYINGMKYNEMETATAQHTLVVGEGVEIGKLTVKKGNIKVLGNGKIGELVKDQSLTEVVYIIASDQAQLPTTMPAGFELVASEEAANMKAAFAKGEGYTLQADADITGANVTVAEGKTVFLDLNGYTVTADNSSSGNIIVCGGFTLKDSRGGGKIVVNKDYQSNCALGIIYAYGVNAKVIMESGSIYAVRPNTTANGQFGVSVSNNAEFTMKGGKIEAGWYAVSTNGTDKTTNKINIEGGELISVVDYALYLAATGITNISGGFINGAAGGVCQRAGTVNISDNVKIFSQGNGNTGNWSDGTGKTGNSAIWISSPAPYGDCVMNISGGTFSSVKGTVLTDEKSVNKIKINVTGGTFSDLTVMPYLKANADVKFVLNDDKVIPGFKVQSGQKVELDMNSHVLTLVEPWVGSTGTETNSCQLLKESTVTFKNGVLKSENSNMIIQNYSNLTLKNMTLSAPKAAYAMSNNNGNVLIENSVISPRTDGGVAFDVYSYSSYAGVTVTVNNSTINGKVEFGGDNNKKLGKLVINGGTFNGDLDVNKAYYDAENKNIIINGGNFGEYKDWGDYK